MHKIVDGIKIDLTEDEIDEISANEAAWPEKKQLLSILEQINALEAQQTKRRERDPLSSDEKIAADGKKWIQTLEAQIEALRLQLRGTK